MKGAFCVSLATVLGFAACSGGDEEEDVSSVEQEGVSSGVHISDGANPAGDFNDPAGTSGFLWHTLVAPNQPDLTGLTFNGGFNTSSRLRAEVRDTSCSGDNDSTGLIRRTISVTTQAGATPPHYKAQFTNLTLGLTVSNCYRLVIILDNEILGFRDAQFVPTAATNPPAGYMKWTAGQNLAAKFGLYGNLDNDGDGVLNHIDNCPNDANPGQEDDNNNGVGNACEAPVDTDGDGVVDGLDFCPTDPAKQTESQTQGPANCGCNIANTDTDSDGFANCNDACDTDSNKTITGGFCGCNFFDVDRDGDGAVESCGNPGSCTFGP